MKKKASWERPFTVKRYLHPPMAEKIITMWPDFRIMCSTITEQHPEQIISSAFRIVTGNEMEPPDFHNVQYEVNKAGAPLHAISSEIEEYTLRMESFCNVSRNPVTYSKISVSNPNDWNVSGNISIMSRTGEERHLTGMEVDGYAHFDNNICNWGFIPNTWRYEKGLLTDGEYELRLQNMERFEPIWQGDVAGEPWHRRHLLKLAFTLSPGEEISFTIAFRHGSVGPYDFEKEKES